MASTLIGLFGGVTGAIGGAITKMGGMSGTFSSLASLMSNPYVLIGALVALAGAIGENEGLILKLQEKFEGLGTVVGGVCEFISGALQLSFGSVINGVMLLFDLIASMLDGAGAVSYTHLVNLSKAITVGLRHNINIKRDDSIGFLSGTVAFRADVRLDAVTTVEEAIAIGNVTMALNSRAKK